MRSPKASSNTSTTTDPAPLTFLTRLWPGWGGLPGHPAATAAGRWRLREGFALETAEAALRAYANLARNDPGGLLKRDRKRSLGVVAPGGRYFVVKVFHRPGPWGPWRPDCRSWCWNWRLERAGLPVPRYHAWLRAGDGQGWLVMEYIPGEHLEAALRRQAGAPARQRELAGLALELLAALYRRGIVHGDLKAQNLILRPAEAASGQPEALLLVDNDDVAFGRRIDAAVRARHCRQLAESLPPGDPLRELLVAEFRRRFPEVGG